MHDCHFIWLSIFGTHLSVILETKAIHTFTHFIWQTEDELREYINDIMHSRLTRMEHVSRHILKHKNTSLEYYIDSNSVPSVPQ